jgi:hypothetical protein
MRISPIFSSFGGEKNKRKPAGNHGFPCEILWVSGIFFRNFWQKYGSIMDDV